MFHHFCVLVIRFDLRFAGILLPANYFHKEQKPAYGYISEMVATLKPLTSDVHVENNDISKMST